MQLDLKYVFGNKFLLSLFYESFGLVKNFV